MSMEALAELGPAYMTDASVAPRLLDALERLPAGQQESTINQAWLDRHWHLKGVRRVLEEISDRWDRFPEPFCDFLHECWHHNDDCWHSFVRKAWFLDDDDMVDDLAEDIHERLLLEGPTPHVLKTMMALRRCYEASVWSFGIIGALVNTAMTDPAPPSRDLLTLWWRYNPSDVEQHAIVRLESTLQAGSCLAPYAARIVHGLSVRHLSMAMMRGLVEMAQGRASIGSTYAMETLVRASCTYRADRVAQAVSGSRQGWHDYMARFHTKTLWLMSTFMRDARAIETMIRLFNDEPQTAIRTGLFARILECDPTEDEMHKVRWVKPLDDVCAETTVHRLHAWGRLETGGPAFLQAVQAYPSAVAVLAKYSPWVRTEMTWARRKLLMCCLACGDARGSGKRGRRATDRVLAALAAHECMWAPVLQFL